MTRVGSGRVRIFRYTGSCYTGCTGGHGQHIYIIVYIYSALLVFYKNIEKHQL